MTPPCPTRRSSDRRCQALPGHVVDDVEHPEPSPRRHLIVHKVQAPPLVRESKHRSRRPRSNGTLATTAAPDRQPFLLVEALGLLAVDHHALPAQQDMQTAIAEPATLVGQLT